MIEDVPGSAVIGSAFDRIVICDKGSRCRKHEEHERNCDVNACYSVLIE